MRRRPFERRRRRGGVELGGALHAVGGAHPTGRRAAAAALAAIALAGCMAEETSEAQQRAFAKNMESCLCRSLEYEADYASGLSWQRMVERCERTVRAANPQRYAAATAVKLALESLRCQREADAWRAARRAS